MPKTTNPGHLTKNFAGHVFSAFARDLVKHVENKLGVKLGETTADNRITLVVEEECLAACCGAPMMVVDGHYHENLDTDKVDEILDGLD